MRTESDTDISGKDTKKKASDSLLNRRLFKKTAATYSPTVAQYHRRDEA